MLSLKRTPGTIIPILKGSVEQSSNSNIYPSLQGATLTKAIHNPQIRIIDFVWGKVI